MDEYQFSPLNTVTVMKDSFHNELSAHIHFILYIITDIFQVGVVNGNS